MKKYEVTFHEVERFTVEIEAEDEEPAEEAARDVLNNCTEEEKWDYHNDSDELSPDISEV